MLTVYTKNACGYCIQAKTLLKKMDIEFEEINIETDTDAREFIISEGHRTMPQIYFQGKPFVDGGFQGLAKLSEDTIRAKMGAVDLGGMQL